MARYDHQRSAVNFQLIFLGLLCFSNLVWDIEARKLSDDLTACQHLRRSETRRSKALASVSPQKRVRIPRCTKSGGFEPIQCQEDFNGTSCWCVDEYGVEIPETRNNTRDTVKCSEPDHCAASSCRMFCSSGFARDARSGCSICKCRDPCDGIECPNGQTCQQQEVKCKTEPCPPIPTCKKGRSLANACPAGLPLSIDDSIRPFLCGIEPGKPQCPPLYQCLVESGNDYGVCCPSTLKFQKPGVCPNPEDYLYSERTGYMCGTPCSHDLECKHMEKCCFTKGCQNNCQQPFNITTCHQARALSDILAVNEREGRGYVPECNGPGGMFSPKQCSRNGLVCWCVDPRTGQKIKDSMGAADNVNCDGWENMIARSVGRSMSMEQCDTNICAAICEYGFKNDHNGCPTCECSEPCEGFRCPMGSHCEVATDPLCESGSALCSSWPICKPDLIYSNPCDIGTPLSDNITGELFYCINEERQSRAYQPVSFFDEDPKLARSMSNRIICPENHKCTKLHGESGNVCCPVPEEIFPEYSQERQQSMCEYLRDFSDRMEGTEEGMQLAIPPPRCAEDGAYSPRQCTYKNIKVTRKEQKQILEENTIRKMKMLLHTRSKRQTESLKLYRVDDGTLNIRVAAPVMGRSAKVISSMGSSKYQDLSGLFETDVKKVAPAPKRPLGDDELVDMEVEECWCVDGFGTEIPESRGFNVTDDSCVQLRESIDCLDLTCRMGCEYGFILSPETKCPACQCRDPCEGVNCSNGKECRTVEVSCEEEYCPPVPACLPRKAGQCPFLVPPSPDNANTCDYECRTDSHCEGTKRCCSNGCGTQCVEPQMKTACQHLQTIQMHQSSELGIPAKQMYIAQCDPLSGKWNEIQCGPENLCWCVNERGEELSGTRIKGKTPTCEINSALECPLQKCAPCENGFKTDRNGCQTCECRNFCDEISCSRDEECQLINVECIDLPCPKMPICVPKRESVCPEGVPLKQGELEVGCGPQNENEACPTTHTCQLNPVTNRGVCCAKTRDVCFESMDQNCVAKINSFHNTTKWRFSPKANKCVPVVVSEEENSCQNKNLFHNELACNSVCPVLTQCERVKLKNSLVARRADQTSVWFQPRCDPITGHWSPIQCLGKQPSSLKESTEISENQLQRLSRAFSVSSDPVSNSQYGVCWCSDKKGAPLKGTLTRNLEPVCNHRQARRRMHANDGPNDPLMEELIKQMTMMVDIEDNDLDTLESADIPDEEIAITEKIYELGNSIISSKLFIDSTKNLMKTTTRCMALKMTASFPVNCDESGAFVPTQCVDGQCWCVDAAGNQLPSSGTFPIGTKECKPTSIDVVSVELNLQNEEGRHIANIYDIVQTELHQLIGDSLENLRVHDNMDGNVIVRFELHRDDKIDKAFAIEENIRQGNLILGYGHLKPDITMSRFIHRQQKLKNDYDDNQELNLNQEEKQYKYPQQQQNAQKPHIPIALATSATNNNTLHTAVFILATSSAFLVSIFVVYVMLKRGKRKTVIHYPENRILGNNADKFVDFSSPIFVLSANDIEPSKLDKQTEIENIKN
ncbi:uncharacterized protein LOC129605792 [Condylostylus longicornis]|uniref:uncharacterized protein LOC129605792 n=1 Tax=Condylostylus longicornis TaxID=2530218 RepID=UPI00244E350B|nr:uncharacterized protein LOC129605792 [Condylostylus longicornis]XP_055371710.1 uncharacterized protein LOC129605792 [Condylostylus longicornis]XP_055371711.1 uncharacterized protein LOC129605792 [Condylostylus longicornis]XP_055371712.1 uncharacterized protein LOC129605792 [Condylostylus longicornis]XP_055371713.1 uncharacterized protein LOC129605792 [Condylostylus longicornis]XP_055371714.1 uncharacterized protein LOC129605792 [Condylostylus longicornis]